MPIILSIVKPAVLYLIILLFDKSRSDLSIVIISPDGSLSFGSVKYIFKMIAFRLMSYQFMMFSFLHLVNWLFLKLPYDT